jgi:basic amino acid/polyamine antiporter, APA family
VHPRFATPDRAILLQAVWASGLIVYFGAFEPLVVYTGFAVTLFSALAVAALILLHICSPDLSRPFRVPMYPWLPIAYVVASGFILAYTAAERPRETILGPLTIATGIPLYLLRRKLR